MVCVWAVSLVMVMWVVFILVGGHCLWVLIVVKGGVVVGDGGAVVIVFPCCPRMSVSFVLKVIVDVAHT